MRRLWEWLALNWRLKLAALGVSLLLWSIVKAEEVVSVYIPDVPVRVSLRDPAWRLATAAPARVGVAVTGPVRDVMRLVMQRPRLDVPVEDVRDSVVVTVLRSSWVHIPGEGRTSVDDIVPGTLRLFFTPVARHAPRNERGGVAPAAESAAPPATLGSPLPPTQRDTIAPSPDSGSLRADTLRPGVHS